jgi:rare lipoprotein A
MWAKIAFDGIACALAAAAACAISTSAKAHTLRAELPAAANLLIAHPLNIDPVASDATAELVRDKLAPQAEALARWSIRSLMGKPPVTGAASTYNPTKEDDRSGGLRTSSGEIYEANAWAAAIQIDLRQAFGGVRYGRNYRPTFALVTISGKSAVVKINDVGPLRPGRIIDLSDRTMRYFDTTMQRGVLANAKVTPLDGADWRPGPLADGPALPMAGDVLPEIVH